MLNINHTYNNQIFGTHLQGEVDKNGDFLSCSIEPIMITYKQFVNAPN